MSKYIDYIGSYLGQVKEIADSIDIKSINSLMSQLVELKKNRGRLFILGVGGSAANASHAVNDFRKIVGIETYSPLDNVSELTARINDEGWDSSISEWLKVSNLNKKDALMIFSVGGGSDNTSQNLVKAMEYAQYVGAKIFGIVSRDGGQTKQMSQACVLIPIIDDDRITPHAEEWQAIVWHMIVNGLKNE